MDLFKAYDCLSDDLLIAKFEAYGLDVGSLNFLLDYLSLRKDRMKVGSSYSKWSEICRWILHGSILDPLLFNIFINGILFFVEKSEICNFADDNITYSCGKDLPKIKEDLICTIKNILKWFRLNFLKANLGKFQFMILGDKTCYNAFIDSQFNYATLIWMFCRETFYSKIEKIHHRILKVIYGIDDSYSNLLLSSNSVSIHQRHLRFLV